MKADQETKTSDNVVSIFASRAKADAEGSADETNQAKKSSSEEDHDFAEEVRRNQQVRDRMKKEREKANRSVLRSYRLKT